MGNEAINKNNETIFINNNIDILTNSSGAKSSRPTVIMLRAGKPVYGGFTLARIPEEIAVAKGIKSKTVLIKGAIPGELIKVLIEEEKKDYYLASVKEVIEPSPDRIEPAPCVGCQLHYIDYDRQVTIKEEVIEDALRRIGGIETGLSEPLFLKGSTWNYRYRGQLKVADGKVGFYREKTREIIDTDYSPLLIFELNVALEEFRKIFHSNPDKFQDVTDIHLSYGSDAFAFIKTDWKSRKTESFWNEVASMLLFCCFDGLYIQTGAKEFLKYGKEFLELNLEGVTYTVSPVTFFQANWKLNQVMVKFIKDSLRPLEGKRVLDLFSGAGNFSLPLALNAGEVVAVEENSFAIEDGKRNLRINGIKNIKFSRSSAETYNISNYGPFDIVILDPPRAGLPEKVVANLLKAKPEKMVYVSCNPSTLSRDLKKLSAGYDISSIRLVDLFPQTYHIESLVFLERS